MIHNKTSRKKLNDTLGEKRNFKNILNKKYLNKFEQAIMTNHEQSEPVVPCLSNSV